MSYTWKHFEVPNNPPDSGIIKIKCKHCPDTFISGNIKSTSNFATHLKRKHKDIFLKSKSDSQSVAQPSMDSYIKSSTTKKYQSNDPSQQIITDALVTFIAGNLIPLSTIENTEFKNLMEALNPQYQIPSRKNLSTKLLYQKSTKIQSSLKDELHSLESICLTIDLWSNRQMKGFLGITGHYILDWCMKSIMITCKRFKGSHCAENIRQEYEEAVASYNIANKITSIITDNASNMTKAFDFSLPGYTVETSDDKNSCDSEDENDDDDNDLTSVDIDFPDNDLPKHGRCFAHTLQLVVKDGLKEASSHLKNVISKAATIVKYVRKSITASEILEDEKRLQSDNATRWNSQLKMIRSVLEIPNSKLLKLNTVNLTDYERNVLSDLCLLLKPFEDATVMVQTDKNVSGSLAVPVTLGLEHTLSELSTTYNNKMVSTLVSSISKRLSVYKQDDVYLLSAMLDPRFKVRWSKNPTEMEEKLLAHARKQTPLIEESGDSNSPPRKVQKCDNSGLFSFMTPTKPKTKHMSGDSIRIEVSQYLLEPCEIDTEPLTYWKENALKYPTLAHMAKVYLAIPATSAPVERLFSVAGKFFRPDRCRLSDNTFQMLMMIRCNSKNI